VTVAAPDMGGSFGQKIVVLREEQRGFWVGQCAGASPGAKPHHQPPCP
jgi:hypothetical protein